MNADSYKLGQRGARAWLILADGVGSSRLPVFRLNPKTEPASEDNLLDARTGLPKERLSDTAPTTDTAIDPKTGLPKHLLPQNPRAKSRGPFR